MDTCCVAQTPAVATEMIGPTSNSGPRGHLDAMKAASEGRRLQPTVLVCFFGGLPGSESGLPPYIAWNPRMLLVPFLNLMF
jgi:hypothetical protein